MLRPVHQSFRQSTHLPSQVNRKVFEAINPYVQNRDYLLKPQNLHYRHKSQPIEDQNIRNEPQQVVQSFQQLLKKARQKGFHMRLASQASDTWNRPLKKPKRFDFQYNKWYIEPSLRLKRPFEFSKNKTQRVATTEIEANRSSFSKVRQSLLVETCDTFVQKPQKQDNRETFVKQFAQKDYKNLALLKQFKRYEFAHNNRKQVASKCRTPQLVQLILQSHKDRKQNNTKLTTNNKLLKTFKPRQRESKLDDWCMQSTACSRFSIEDYEVVNRDRCKNGGFRKEKKKLTLLETEYAKIKENISREIDDTNRNSDGMKIERFRMRP